MLLSACPRAPYLRVEGVAQRLQPRLAVDELDFLDRHWINERDQHLPKGPAQQWNGKCDLEFLMRKFCFKCIQRWRRAPLNKGVEAGRHTPTARPFAEEQRVVGVKETSKKMIGF